MSTPDDDRPDMSAFMDELVELNKRSQAEPAGVRCLWLITTAISIMDVQSGNDRMGQAVSEEEFIVFCRLVYRKLRGAIANAPSA